MMTQQQNKSSVQMQNVMQDFVGSQRSIDLIELGSRQDIDWQAEGQRVLEMLNEPVGQQKPSNPHAA